MQTLENKALKGRNISELGNAQLNAQLNAQSDNTQLGKQTEGESPFSIKEMAIRALLSLGKKQYNTIVDIGAGCGELTHLIAPFAQKVVMLDDFDSPTKPQNATFAKVDLNDFWDIENNSIDFGFSLEVIEHIENPRHFMREMARIIKPNGYGFVSTPNQQNIFSRLYFLFKKEHRWFQDNCYPAHISALMEKDFRRILAENNLELVGFFYNYEDAIPFIHTKIQFKLAIFSSSIGVLFRKK